MSYRRGERKYNPAVGVKTDFENLLTTFTATESVRYEEFASIWRKLKFSFLYAGRQNDREAREFVEECFKHALVFFLPPSNFQVRVGGLYLIYGLYSTQPCVPKVKIRVTAGNWEKILKFHREVKSQQHFDVEFIFDRLYLIEQAFHFVATPTEMYPLTSERAEDTKEQGRVPEEWKDDRASLQNILPEDMLEQLSAVHQQYENLKIGLAGPGAVRPDRSLDVLSSDLIQGIVDIAKQHKEKLKRLENQSYERVKRKHTLHELEDSDDEDDEEEDPTFSPQAQGSERANIKAKAFSQVAKQTRLRGRASKSAAISSPVKSASPMRSPSPKKRKKKSNSKTAISAQEKKGGKIKGKKGKSEESKTKGRKTNKNKKKACSDNT